MDADVCHGESGGLVGPSVSAIVVARSGHATLKATMLQAGIESWTGAFMAILESCLNV